MVKKKTNKNCSVKLGVQKGSGFILDYLMIFFLECGVSVREVLQKMFMLCYNCVFRGGVVDSTLEWFDPARYNT